MIALLVLTLASCSGGTGSDTGAARKEAPAAPPPAETQKTEPESLGFFETPLNDAGRPRITNISLAIKKINGYVIEPDAEFSFNNVVGRRTVERGYKKATIFRGTREVKETGGGICQLSTTLYCAAKRAGLEITERHEHSKPVDYVSRGEDATVYYGRLDLRFKNTRDVPIVITCAINRGKVQAKIAAAPD